MTLEEATLLGELLKVGGIFENKQNKELFIGLRKKGLVKLSSTFQEWTNDTEYEITSLGIFELNLYEKEEKNEDPSSKRA